MQEITINEIIKEYCKEICENPDECINKTTCTDINALKRALQGCTITRKTNRDLADELYAKGKDALRRGCRADALDCYEDACELYQKQDEL